jgi:hypothetical protein
MSRTSFKIKSPYNKQILQEKLNKINISQEGSYILTKYDDRVISDTKVSNLYQIFDFKEFSKNILNEIENYFMPEFQQISIYSGRQELRLLGEEVIVNGDKYHKMFNLLNSTDKSRSLQINIGLMRLVCTNGMIVGLENEYSNIRVKHFKATLPEKIEEFNNSMKNFNVSIEKQCGVIESLNNKFISFKELAQKLIWDEKLEENSDSKILKLRSFAKKLLNSDTDRLDSLNLEQTKFLKNPQNYLDKEIDIEIPAYKAFNCYIECYREYDSATMNLETNRLLQLISKTKTMGVRKHYIGAVMEQIHGYRIRQMITDNEKQTPTGKFGVYRGKKLDKVCITVVEARGYINEKIN